MSFLRPPSRFPVVADVEGFRSVMVNYYFVRSSLTAHDWVLVDAGLRGCGPRILADAKRRFGRDNPPRAIVLTHGHFDHVGALPWLLERWHTPIFAHSDELPYLNQREPYPSPDPTVGGGLLALSSVVYPRRVPPLPMVVQPLPDDGSVPGLPGWKWIPTPGHTAGHVSLWRAQDRLLIAGDALIGTRQESAAAVLRQTREVRPPPAYYYAGLAASLPLDRARAAAGARHPRQRTRPADRRTRTA